MKHTICSIVLGTLLLSTGANAGTPSSRTTVIAPYQTGPFAVATSTLLFDEAKTDAIEEDPKEYQLAGEYLSGANRGGKQKYVTDILIPATTTIRFNVTMPVDRALYGTSAGKTIPYAGILYFPTSKANSDEDGQLPIFGNLLPKMLPADGKPSFCNPRTKYPLIVLSHGLNSDPLAHWELSAMLASHGYSVFALYHGDKRFSAFEKEPLEKLATRCRSISEGISYLQNSRIYGAHIDFTRIGVAGVSYGGTTAAALCGAIVQTGKGHADLSDRRIKAAATMVPWMGDEKNRLWGQTHDGAAAINIPFLAISGVDDDIARYPVTLDVMRRMSGLRYLVGIEKAGHSFSPAMVDIMHTVTLIFFEAQLKNNRKAITLMNTLKNVNVTQEMHFFEF